MKRRFIILPVLAMLASMVGGLTAQAHQCPDNDPNHPDCEETETVPSWREGNYVPLFDIGDREDPDQRRDAQRWHEECDNWQPGQGGYQSRQMCFWMYGGVSGFPNRGSDPSDPNNYSPNEWHVGFAATHCFLFEFAHQCEDHFENGEGTHDAHGGAVYADICLTENPDSKYCDEGLKDTQVGVTIMDHNPCGTVVPVVACTDEYHVIRPLDGEYTQDQMNDSLDYIPQILDDPETYLCGKPEYRAGNPLCPEPDDEGGRGAAAPTDRVMPGSVAQAIATAQAARAAGVDPAIAHAEAVRTVALAARGAGDARGGAGWLLMLVMAALAFGPARRLVLR